MDNDKRIFQGDFFLSRLLNRIIWLPWPIVLMIGWLITPGMMFVLGWILESRTLPIIENSRAFLPGDFFLGLILASSAVILRNSRIRRDSFVLSKRWLIFASVLTAVAVFLVGKLVLDRGNYTIGQILSPTKLWHDIIVYMGYGPIIATMAIPALLPSPGESLLTRCLRIGMIAGIIIFGSCLVLDSASSLEYRRLHIEWWSPFWAPR